jgi:CheY-like chemotaxis protein
MPAPGSLESLPGAMRARRLLWRLQPFPNDTMQDRLKVLIADDQPDSLELLRELLTVYHFELKVAPTGLEAIRIGLKWEPDLLITDIAMPDADGRHVASRLKLSLPALVAIAVSGTPLNTDFESAEDLVFDDYFVKPLNWARLHAVLTRHGAKLVEPGGAQLFGADDGADVSLEAPTDPSRRPER